MASDPIHPGLGELGQRLQALSDPAPEPPRLRPYQGSQPQQTTAAPPYTDWRTAAPAHPEPFPAPGAADAAKAASNGYTHVPGMSSAAAPAAEAQPQPQAAPVDPAIPSGLQRVINTVRQTLPLVQRLLPVLEGNIATAATAITALVAPQPSVQHIHHPPPAPPAPAPVPAQVDLEPLERGLGEVERSLGEVERSLTEVRATHRELRTQVVEHVSALKRVEDQLDHVREATDRNTLEQQELVEDLRAVGGRVNTFALIGLILLVLSLLVNAFLVFQLQRILH